MALQKLRLTKLNISDKLIDPATGQPTAFFVRLWNDAINNIELTLNSQTSEITLIEEALTTAGIALTTAQTVNKVNALANSYTTPGAILSSTVSTANSAKAKITIASHVRHYGDGTTANVTGGSVDLLTQGAIYYIVYDDSARTGGTVTYQALTGATAYLDAGQTGVAPHPDRHACGSITTAVTPSGGGTPTPTYGGGPRPSGTGGGYTIESQP